MTYGIRIVSCVLLSDGGANLSENAEYPKGDVCVNLTSAKHERDVGFIKGDPHFNWQDAFWDV